mmetsp:Transcript_40009/g.94043  ORF Transcript_40009/g.94043 Transcript_40009/m.94043 type:complete len:100 (+) Transcript_40009:92-391(+)
MGAKLIWANKRLVTAATTFAITGYVAAAHYQQQRTVMKESEQIVARALEQESKGEAVIRKAVPIPENRMNLYTAQSQKLNSRNSQGYYGMFTGEYTDAK